MRAQVSEKTQSGLSYIAPPKPALPGHEESYHPPAEYLPSEVSCAISRRIQTLEASSDGMRKGDMDDRGPWCLRSACAC